MFEEAKTNYYDILDVTPDATQSDIRQAYIRAKSAYSRDSQAIYSIFDIEEAKRVVSSIEEAYIVLSSPEKRREYDRLHGILKQFDEELGGPTSAEDTDNMRDFILKRAAQVKMAKQSGDNNNTDSSASFFSDTPKYSSVTATSFESDYTDSYRNQREAESSTSYHYTSSSHSNTLVNNEPVESIRTSTPKRHEIQAAFEVDPAIETEIANETDFRGPFLKKIREYKNISLDEMSDFTKVSKAYLSAIETETFQQLPAAAYLRGFIIQIARALRLSPEKTSAGYMSYYKLRTQKP